jgi:hypothetical protein
VEALAPGTWGMLIWGILFPVLWATVMATAREDGHHLRLLTAFLFVVVGGVIWAVGMTVGAIAWGVAARRGP